MTIQNARFYILLTAIFLFFASCNPEDETIVKASNLNTTIDENPNSEQSIGTIEASTNEGSLKFKIIEQFPSGAMSIDSLTGELKVANTTHFDFEINPLIKGQVKVYNGDVYKNITIKISVIDVIECDQSHAMSEGLFSDLINNSGFEVLTTMDLPDHGISFKMDTDGELCSIGYQGLSDEPYLIKVLNANGELLYNERLIFSTTEQNYVSIPSIHITANETYIISRIKESGSLSEIVGKFVKKFPVDHKFPYTYEHLTILDCVIEGLNLPDDLVMIPYITFGFIPE